MAACGGCLEGKLKFEPFLSFCALGIWENWSVCGSGKFSK